MFWWKAGTKKFLETPSILKSKIFFIADGILSEYLVVLSVIPALHLSTSEKMVSQARSYNDASVEKKKIVSASFHFHSINLPIYCYPDDSIGKVSNWKNIFYSPAYGQRIFYHRKIACPPGNKIKATQCILPPPILFFWRKILQRRIFADVRIFFLEEAKIFSRGVSILKFSPAGKNIISLEYLDFLLSFLFISHSNFFLQLREKILKNKPASFSLTFSNPLVFEKKNPGKATTLFCS